MNTRSVVLAAAITSLIGSTVSAQEASAPASKRQWEFLVTSGALMPTGTQGDAIRSANLSAAQLTYVVRPAVAITSAFGWARSRDIASIGSPKLDVFTYDIGAELRTPHATKNLMAFAGIGAGGRSYNYRKLDVDATHNLSAYASAGGELGIKRVRVRLEARDYVSGFKSLTGAGESRTGNDVVVMAGLRIVSR